MTVNRIKKYVNGVVKEYNVQNFTSTLLKVPTCVPRP